MSFQRHPSVHKTAQRMRLKSPSITSKREATKSAQDHFSKLFALQQLYLALRSRLLASRNIARRSLIVVGTICEGAKVEMTVLVVDSALITLWSSFSESFHRELF